MFSKLRMLTLKIHLKKKTFPKMYTPPSYHPIWSFKTNSLFSNNLSQSTVWGTDRTVTVVSNSGCKTIETATSVTCFRSNSVI